MINFRYFFDRMYIEPITIQYRNLCSILLFNWGTSIFIVFNIFLFSVYEFMHKFIEQIG